ncbi:MAG TPA: phosphoenolpyruvate carboxykinase [Vicinamibacterales bacterium]|nr:phosphoenolpyruvate carboxykinase [Vicinamibacterales bacterium]
MSQGERKVGLDAVGIEGAGQVHWTPAVATLYEEAVRRREGVIAANGPLICRTAPHTGRSPNDKFIVREASSEQHVAWGKVNRPIDAAAFDGLHRRMMAHLTGRELFVQDCWAGADPAFRLPIRVITERAWHSLFARHLFIPEPDPSRLASHEPQFTVIDVPSVTADPKVDATNSETFILVNFARRLVLIGGTNYAGEIKKSIFTVMNYLLPLRDVMPMHCSANIGPDGDVALFFGLSGTGKTTLSSDHARQLIGDDEHGWSRAGVFNFEGGCYAKMIRLSAEAEPQIHATTRRFGTVLENVVYDPITRDLNLDDDANTENTRGAYPLGFIDNSVPGGQGGHPTNVIMLTADAFGVLPPIAKLSPEAAMYHFLSGYTAKVAGTERGVTEPKATFSTCFGAPFMVWDPNVYARLLGERIAQHQSKVWLVNTGWTGGPYGTGSRMKIAHTRAMIDAALSGALDDVACDVDPVFNLAVPKTCPGVPADVLTPRKTWKDAAAYDVQAGKLARMFADNFKTFEATATPEVKAAGPKG